MLLFHLVSYVFMGVMGIPGYFFFRNPKNLQRCHVWVKALADRGEHSEAAGVAALMGKYGPAKTLKIAKGSFRGIGFGSLCETDFDDNAARWELSASTVKSRLGAVDAFLSHSWKDPAKPKWAAIRRWASTFHAKHNRMPVLWLDKACIDQSRIEESLAVLPVFLSGCRELLVVAGPSYCDRLWCAAVCPRGRWVRPPHTQAAFLSQVRDGDLHFPADGRHRRPHLRPPRLREHGEGE